MKRRCSGGVAGSGAASRRLGASLRSCTGHPAKLGIPEKEMAIDWNLVVFNMLTIKGIYGREMYETWYKMTVMLESGLNIKPLITHRFQYTDFQKRFDAMLSGQCGKVVLDWVT